eukprot:EG_transcript_13334
MEESNMEVENVAIEAGTDVGTEAEVTSPSCGDAGPSFSGAEAPQTIAEEDLVPCPVCNVEFPSASIQRHANSCLDAVKETVTCPVCEKPLTSLEAVDLHIACEHEILPFECPICFENKGKRAVALCCKQELCMDCASQPIRACPFCRAASWKWVPAVVEDDLPEEGCSCLALFMRLCGLGSLLRYFRRKRK